MNLRGMFEEIASFFSSLARRGRLNNASPCAIPQLIYQMTTQNGYCIETQLGMGLNIDGDLVHSFVIYRPTGLIRWCSVILPDMVAAVIDRYCESDLICERSRFLMAICEEALASYLMQNATFPADGFLLIDRLSDLQMSWIDAVLCRRPVCV